MLLPPEKQHASVTGSSLFLQPLWCLWRTSFEQHGVNFYYRSLCCRRDFKESQQRQGDSLKRDSPSLQGVLDLNEQKSFKNPSSIGLTCIPHMVVMAAGWTFWICFSNLDASPLCVANTGEPTAKQVLLLYWFLLDLTLWIPLRCLPQGNLKFTAPPPLLPVTSTFKTDSCLVQRWKTPNNREKVRVKQTGVLSLSSRPQTWLPFCKRKKKLHAIS